MYICVSVKTSNIPLYLDFQKLCFRRNFPTPLLVVLHQDIWVSPATLTVVNNRRSCLHTGKVVVTQIDFHGLRRIMVFFPPSKYCPNHNFLYHNFFTISYINRTAYPRNTKAKGKLIPECIVRVQSPSSIINYLANSLQIPRIPFQRFCIW